MAPPCPEDAILSSLSWSEKCQARQNGQSLKEVFPWGTIRTPTPEANRQTAMELSAEERMEVTLLSAEFIRQFNYESFLE